MAGRGLEPGEVFNEDAVRAWGEGKTKKGRSKGPGAGGSGKKRAKARGAGNHVSARGGGGRTGPWPAIRFPL